MKHARPIARENDRLGTRRKSKKTKIVTPVYCYHAKIHPSKSHDRSLWFWLVWFQETVTRVKQFPTVCESPEKDAKVGKSFKSQCYDHIFHASGINVLLLTPLAIPSEKDRGIFTVS